jgi:DNA-binding transcriptional ArsR family regulator
MSDLCDEIQKLGKGISNAARYYILESLVSGPKTVGELVKIANLSQPAVSQHLKTLKACNLVEDEKKGQEVYYSLNTEYTLKILKSFLTNLSKSPKKNFAQTKQLIRKNL